MRKSVMYTIGGGITRRNLTTNSAEILTEVAVKLWRLNKTKLQRIGMIKPTTSTAVDYLIYHAARDGHIDLEVPLTPKNNLYLAIIK